MLYQDTITAPLFPPFLFFLSLFIPGPYLHVLHKANFSAHTGLVISFSYGTYPFISWALPEGRKYPFIICASINCFLKGHHQPSSTIRVRNWPGITNGAIIRHSPAQTLSYLTTLKGLEVQCPEVKDLRNSAPVFLGTPPQLPTRLLIKF